ncbi:hemin-degrading factor [Mesobaculum littorinae]|uniref:Hemin-degrading factor n=2 Tax=Mesobaculum littorinae TaxID=2486419 RepID=A0A438AJU7_9RHOB|nr:hemin-degrading factor [Mesobaculum littorinae]
MPPFATTTPAPPADTSRTGLHAAPVGAHRRPRDMAEELGLREAELVAARVGDGATRIDPAPDRLIPRLTALGPVMGLTRNDHAVSEKIGVYDAYVPGQHAAMVLSGEIDLRIFPRHWVHAFAVETEQNGRLRRSIQVFDAAGDAVHKIHLRDGSDADAFAALVTDLATEDMTDHLDLVPRDPVEAAKSVPEKRDVLLAEWDRMTDTHQFLRLTSKLRMNRLGAYRLAGAPRAERLAPGATEALVTALAASGTAAMIFVGNRGCIQIHGGPVGTPKTVEPWFNILDPGFNLHLRGDRIAEIWRVTKPTKRGPALSLECFDAEGGLILQIFARRDDADPEGRAFATLLGALPATTHALEA